MTLFCLRYNRKQTTNVENCVFKRVANDVAHSLSFAYGVGLALQCVLPDVRRFYQMLEGKTFRGIFHLLLKKKYIHLKTSFKFTSKVKSASMTLQLVCEK